MRIDIRLIKIEVLLVYMDKKKYNIDCMILVQTLVMYQSRAAFSLLFWAKIVAPRIFHQQP